MWFDSPPHHVNMVRQNATQIGVGRWKGHWTQNFGIGPRLMFAAEAERNRLAVRGDILKPDMAITAPEERRGLPGLPLDLIQQRDLDE
jgi:hypothetical protein